MKLQGIYFKEIAETSPDDCEKLVGIEYHYWLNFGEKNIHFSSASKGLYICSKIPSEAHSIPLADEASDISRPHKSFFESELVGIFEILDGETAYDFLFENAGVISFCLDYFYMTDPPSCTYWKPLFFTSDYLNEPENAEDKEILTREMLNSKEKSIENMPILARENK